MQYDAMPPSEPSEADVVTCMRQFAKRLHSGDFNGLWIPELVVIDCELDDTLCWLLLEYIYRCGPQPSRLKVLVQLPPDTGLDSVHAKLGGFGLEIFRDPGS